MKICFDIDGVLATTVEDLDYMEAGPIQENIDLANKLFEDGHYIVLYTARGSETGIDWFERTEKQLAGFGLRWHKLVLGKPAADYYVDDKLVTIEQLKELLT